MNTSSTETSRHWVVGEYIGDTTTSYDSGVITPPMPLVTALSAGEFSLLTWPARNPITSDGDDAETLLPADAFAFISYKNGQDQNFLSPVIRRGTIKRVTHQEYESYTPVAIKIDLPGTLAIGDEIQLQISQPLWEARTASKPLTLAFKANTANSGTNIAAAITYFVEQINKKIRQNVNNLHYSAVDLGNAGEFYIVANPPSVYYFSQIGVIINPLEVHLEYIYRASTDKVVDGWDDGTKEQGVYTGATFTSGIWQDDGAYTTTSVTAPAGIPGLGVGEPYIVRYMRNEDAGYTGYNSQWGEIPSPYIDPVSNKMTYSIYCIEIEAKQQVASPMAMTRPITIFVAYDSTDKDFETFFETLISKFK
jgi:hypothetical protein